MSHETLRCLWDHFVEISGIELEESGLPSPSIQVYIEMPIINGIPQCIPIHIVGHKLLDASKDPK